jgi:hypothetical protein
MKDKYLIIIKQFNDGDGSFEEVHSQYFSGSKMAAEDKADSLLIDYDGTMYDLERI